MSLFWLILTLSKYPLIKIKPTFKELLFQNLKSLKFKAFKIGIKVQVI